MWDPEWLDTETMNLRMPGESFPLSQKCTFEPDSWWCYHSHSRNVMDDPEWYLFSYHEGKIFSRDFRCVFGAGSSDDEHFKNRGWYKGEGEDVQIIKFTVIAPIVG
jgi:hypothetical protein